MSKQGKIKTVFFMLLLLEKALHRIRTVYFLSFVLVSVFSNGYAHGELLGSSVVEVKGELKKWHKVSVEVVGPVVSESGIENPFLDYRLEVTFRQGSKSYVVPGYYAGDGNAGESSAVSGDVWKAHFTPDATGSWSYSISFRKGKGIAVSEAAGNALEADGVSGNFTVGASDKHLPDNRARGRLEYVGGHYLRYAESGKYFLKGGPDAPENFLAYGDFDGSQNSDGISDKYIKSWSAHKQDWRSGDASWQGGKGKGMIGAINYLASEGLNVFSFLTMNINGDDKNVFPYIKYNGTLSSSPVEDRLRFDVSKLDQWEMVFEHAETLGMYLHFKLQETENDVLLDGGKLGIERKLYYREMIARFGHHLALNWNLGEEYRLWAKVDDPTNEYLKQYGQYFKSHDPYQHHVVVHTHPDKKEQVYPYVVGKSSGLTGASLQSHYSKVHEETKYWLQQSVKAGKAWVVANDEQNPHQEGVLPDGASNNHDIMRKQALWGNLMAGGSGCEFYFGYEYAHSDLTCEDWRSRDGFWDYVRHALGFFNQHIPYWEMENADALVGNTTDSNNKYCMAKAGELYVVYLADGGSTSIDLSSAVGTYTVEWYNPRKGGKLQTGSVEKISGSGGSIGTPPVEANGTNQDWVAVLQRSGDASLQISKLVLYDTDKQSIISDPLQDGAVLQLKDNISIVAVSEPSVVGSVKFSVDGVVEHISNSLPYAIGGSSGGATQEAGAFVEKDGMVMWEAESVPPQGGWQLQQEIKGYSGSGYYTWMGENYFNNPPSSGMLRYVVKITQAGNYEFVFHTKNTYGIRHEHNDSWVKIPTGKDVGGEEPLKGDWNKVYQSQANIWSWQTYTVDGVQNPIRVYLSAGVHEVWLAGRSTGHGVDRLGLYQYEKMSMTPEKLDAQSNSQQISGETNLNPWPLTLGQHTISVTPFLLNDAIGEAGKNLSISFNVIGGGNTNRPPAAPDNLQANGVSVNQINLTWKDNAADEDGFKIERSSDGGKSFTTIATVGQNVTSYSNKNLKTATDYQYRVKAYNSVGSSAYSNIVNAATDPEPTPDDGGGGSAIPEVSLLPIADSWVHGSYKDKNYGHYDKIHVRYVKSYDAWTRESFLRFDLSNEGGTIQKAELILHVMKATDPVEHAVSFVSDDNWAEDGITFNNKPAKESGYISKQKVTGTGVVTFDVTSKVQQQLGERITLMVHALQNVKPYIAYASKEHSRVNYRPVLKITYGEETPTVPPMPAPTPEPTPEPVLAVTKFVLYNATTDEIIGAHDPIQDGAVINLDNFNTNEISIEAITQPQTVGSVQFKVNGKHFRTENVAPYALNGDEDGNFGPWNFSPGVNTISAIPYSAAKLSGEKGEALTVTITLKKGTSLRVENLDTKKKDNKVQSVISTEVERAIVVYPNPARDVLYVTAHRPGTYHLFGLQGHKVKSGEILDGDAASINVATLPAGIYFLTITTEEGTSSQKVLIQH